MGIFRQERGHGIDGGLHPVGQHIHVGHGYGGHGAENRAENIDYVLPGAGPVARKNILDKLDRVLEDHLDIGPHFLNSGPQGPQDSAQHRETAGNSGDPGLYRVVYGGPDRCADLQNGSKSGHSQIAQPGQRISKNILEALQGFITVARKHAGDKISYSGKYAQDIPGHRGQQIHRPLQSIQQRISQHFQQGGRPLPI